MPFGLQPRGIIPGGAPIVALGPPPTPGSAGSQPRAFATGGPAPPMGPPMGPPRSAPPLGLPPRGLPAAFNQSVDGVPRGPPASLPRGPVPSGPPPRGGTAFGPPAPRVPPPPTVSPPGQIIAPPTAAAPPKFGRLTIICIRASDLKQGLGIFGKANPYARLRIGIQEFTTKSNTGGGKNPVWNEEFAFDISSEKDMEIEVLDKETVGNDKFMGSCRVSILDWIASGKFDGSINMLDKAEKVVGNITLSAKFERPSTLAAQVKEKNEVDKLALTPYDGAIGLGNSASRDPNGKFTDDEILEAFRAFDLDKNNFIGAAEIRYVRYSFLV